MTDAYIPSELLYKVDKLKLLKVKGREEWVQHDVGVVKQLDRTPDEVYNLLAGKLSSRTNFSIVPIYVGWTVGGVIVDDGWLIRKYGLLKDDLIDAA